MTFLCENITILAVQLILNIINIKIYFLFLSLINI